MTGGFWLIFQSFGLFFAQNVLIFSFSSRYNFIAKGCNHRCLLGLQLVNLFAVTFQRKYLLNSLLVKKVCNFSHKLNNVESFIRYSWTFPNDIDVATQIVTTITTLLTQIKSNLSFFLSFLQQLLADLCALRWRIPLWFQLGGNLQHF